MSKKQKHESTIQAIWEVLKEKGTNLKFMMTAFSIQGLTGSKEELFFSAQDQVYVLGQKIDTSEMKLSIKLQNKYLSNLFSQIIWITYRKNFQELLSTDPFYQIEDGSNTSDNGWGCMVRVGQMIYAEALRRFLYKAEAHKLHHYQLIPIVLQFTDCEDSPFSIQNIAREGNEHFYLLPGEWYTPNRICFVLKQLHERKQKSDSEAQMKQSNVRQSKEQQYEWKEPNIEKLLFYNQNNDTPLILEKIIQKFCGKHVSLCNDPSHINLQNKKKKMSEDDIEGNLKNSTSISDSKFQMVNNEKKQYPPIVCPQCHKSDKSMVLFISCRIGIEYPQPEYIEILKKLMDLKYSIGVIGGRPKQALYFPGRINDKFIYLDPHYVQNGTTLQSALDTKTFKSYFTNKLQTYLCYDIDSSLALGYYFENIQEFEQFYQDLMHLKSQDRNFFLWMEKIQPDYLDDSEDEEYETQRKKKFKKQKQYNTYQSSSDFSIIEEDSDIEEVDQSQNQNSDPVYKSEVDPQLTDSICIYSEVKQSENNSQAKDSSDQDLNNQNQNQKSIQSQLDSEREDIDPKKIDDKQYFQDYQTKQEVQAERITLEEKKNMLRKQYNCQEFETLNYEWDFNQKQERVKKRSQSTNPNTNFSSFQNDILGNLEGNQDKFVPDRNSTNTFNLKENNIEQMVDQLKKKESQRINNSENQQESDSSLLQKLNDVQNSEYSNSNQNSDSQGKIKDLISNKDLDQEPNSNNNGSNEQDEIDDSSNKREYQQEYYV